MQLKVGSYAFSANSVQVGSHISTEYTPFGLPIRQTKTLEVSGYLDGSDQDSLTTATTNLETALTLPNPSIILYQDSGAASATKLLSVGALGGVRITSGPNFEPILGNDYVNLRKFTFTAEATYAVVLGTFPGLWVEFNETVSLTGGGPLYVLRPNILGEAQRQLVYPLTPLRVAQAGSGKGWRTWPPIPTALFPGALLQPGNVNRGSPEPIGFGQYQNYPITWSYEMGFTTPQEVTPTFWPQQAF